MTTLCQTDTMLAWRSQMSTVGYGDFSPTTPALRLFTILWIFVAIVGVFPLLTNAIVLFTEGLNKRGRTLIEMIIKPTFIDVRSCSRGRRATVPEKCRAPHSCRHHLTRRHARLEPRRCSVQVDGDGVKDFKKMETYVATFYAKNMMPATMLWLALQIICAGGFHAIEGAKGLPGADGWGYGSAFYHCLVTATTVRETTHPKPLPELRAPSPSHQPKALHREPEASSPRPEHQVGYGDLSIATDSGRIWACFHILFSVAMLGEVRAGLSREPLRR